MTRAEPAGHTLRVDARRNRELIIAADEDGRAPGSLLSCHLTGIMTRPADALPS